MTQSITAAMTQTADSFAGVTLSGREIAMQRRQAMARLGKVGAGRTAASSTAAAQVRQAVQRTPAAAMAVVQATPVKPARARREALSRMGKAALPSAAQQQAQSNALRQNATARAVTTSVATSVTTTQPAIAQDAQNTNVSRVAADTLQTMPLMRPTTQATGRALAQARRAVLAQEGKTGLKRVAQATRIAAMMPDQNWQAAISQGATGRQIAMQRRLVQSLAGRVGDNSSSVPARASGRVRPTVAKGEAPVKVEESHTLAGQRLTGTLVDRSKKVTGTEAGAARAITGTEYMGAEHDDRLKQARPPRGPQKVGTMPSGQSEKDKTLTGTQVGRSSKVTGDEAGSDRKLTGTAYATSAAPADAGKAPGKVAITHTAQGKAVTGTPVGRDTKITGDDRGNCQRVTGTEYLSAEQFQTECNTALPAATPKVSVMSSQGSQPVSGTAVGRSSKVTGDEPGSCRSVTGSQYYNSNDFATLCANPSPRQAISVMASVSHTATRRGARDAGNAFPKSSGDAVHEASHVTAASHSAPHPFSLDRRPAANFTNAATVTTVVIPAYAVTGDRPGAGGSALTGDERGATLPVSGTPYIGSDNAATQRPPQSQSQLSSGRFLSRTRSWQDLDSNDRQEPPIDFSIHTPAREAQDRSGSAVTGGDYGSQRITGPANKAGGLITGTPDFRHQRAMAPTTPPATNMADVTAAQRLTGEGSQSGTRVTGDAWQEQRHVTGTEGASALARNPSLRGQPRAGVGMMMGVGGAQQFREIERPPVPESRITGSSGSTSKGAMVTGSGGARA